MARRLREDEEWDDDESDEGDDEEASDDDELTIPCPYCKRQIHEDSPRSRSKFAEILARASSLLNIEAAKARREEIRQTQSR